MWGRGESEEGTSRSSDEEAASAAAPVVIITMGMKLDEVGSRVNAHPVEYFGPAEDPASDLLRVTFAVGRTLIVSDEAAPPGAGRHEGFLKHQSAGHGAIAAAPAKFAAARCAVTGMTPLHGCAFNGYLDTMRLLVEEGKADHRVRTADGIDCRTIAHYRGHVAIRDYCDRLDRDRNAREKRAKEEEQRRMEEEYGGNYEAVMAERERLRRKLEEQMRIEEERRKLLAPVASDLRDQGPKTVKLFRWRGIDIEVETKRNMGFYPRMMRGD